jgi:hypothetical protein
MHTRQGLGSFGGRGHGDYRAELQAALQAVATYLTAWELPMVRSMVRVDGQYGDSSVMADSVASGAQIVVRKRGSRWLGHPLVQAAIAHAPVAPMTTRESQVTYAVFDVPQMLLEDGTTPVRLLLTRRTWKRGEPVSGGKVVGDGVYEHEQFVTTLPPDGFLATDVLDLYQGRGAFEGTLADEDRAGDPDRWCSLSASGQEFWQIVWQGVWNLRLAFCAGSTLAPLRCARWRGRPHPRRRARRSASQRLAAPRSAGAAGRACVWAARMGPSLGRTMGRGAEAFSLQDDGMLLCPQGVGLWLSEIRHENPFTERFIFVAKDADCASGPVRAACLGRTASASGKRGRRVSAVRHRRITGVVLSPRPPVSVRSGPQVERCCRAPVAPLLDEPLAPANGHGGILPRELVATSPASPCGPLPPAPELAGAPRTQCAGPAARHEHPGLGRDTTGPRAPPASPIRPASKACK